MYEASLNFTTGTVSELLATVDILWDPVRRAYALSETGVSN